ncbi:MAG: patatin-like phospholipase family protein [Myxococcota bacterium]|nr:patatin-like phospholipase family protein [Myxococcota bacterium]
MPSLKGLKTEHYHNLMRKIAQLVPEDEYPQYRTGLPENYDAHPEQIDMVTVADLAILHHLDSARFKRLGFTGNDVFAGAHRVNFSYETTPNVPVALAARISCAHPILLTNVTMESPFDSSRKSRVFNDGGVASHVPIQNFL